MKSLLVILCLFLQRSHATRQLLLTQSQKRELIDDLHHKRFRYLATKGKSKTTTASMEAMGSFKKGPMYTMKKNKEKSTSMKMKSFKGKSSTKGKRTKMSKSTSMKMKSFKGKSSTKKKSTKGSKGVKDTKKHPSKSTETDTGLPTLADVIADNQDLSTFQAAIEAVDVGEVFATAEPLTILAPLNSAFELFAEEYPDLVAVLLTTPWELHLLDLVFSHVIEGKAALAADLTDMQVLSSSGGQDIVVRVTDTDVCFTPSLDDEACVVDADVVASNGVAHVVEGVITATWVYYSIYLATVGSLPTLSVLIECAGLKDVFTNEIGLTLFAPSEAALAGLDTDTLCSTPDALLEILFYHTVDQVLPSSQIPEGTSTFATVQGSAITLVHTDPGLETASLTVDGAQTISIDVGANNGMIHVIDQLLSIPAQATSSSPGGGRGDGAPEMGMNAQNRFRK